jgi:hypothetical protein
MGLNVLVSFAEKPKQVERCLRPDWRVLLDSGAFTNFQKQRDVVKLDEYVSYLKENGHRFWRYFALDRIADPTTSRANLYEMLAAGLRPVPVFQRGAKRADLEELKTVSDVVGVGGIAGRMHGEEHRKYLRRVVAAADGHNLHLLGVGKEEIFREFRPYSADSSRHALRHGTLRFWHERRIIEMHGRGGKVMLDHVPVAERRSLYARLCAEYEFDPAGPFTREFYGSVEARVVNVRSFIRYQMDMRRLGVRYFIALVDADIPHAISAWELEKRCGRVPADSSSTQPTA